MKHAGLLFITILLASCVNTPPPIPAPIIYKKVVHITQWTAPELFELARIKRELDAQQAYKQSAVHTSKSSKVNKGSNDSDLLLSKSSFSKSSPNIAKLQPYYIRQQNYQAIQVEMVKLVGKLVEYLQHRDIHAAVVVSKISGNVRNNKHNERAKKIILQYLKSELHRQWNSGKDIANNSINLRAQLLVENDVVKLQLSDFNKKNIAQTSLPDYFFYRYVDGIRMDYK
jgi:hypothetical protein